MSRARDVAAVFSTGVSTTELGYLDGVTSALQTQINGKLNLAGGKILQVVRATDTTDRSTTSTSYVDVTGLAVTITPQKSDSAILLITTGRVYADRAAAGDKRFGIAITDNSNVGISGASNLIFGGQNDGANINFYGINIFAYATPATTSAVTYKTRFYSVNASTTTVFQNSAVTAQMYAIEVSA